MKYGEVCNQGFDDAAVALFGSGSCCLLEHVVVVLSSMGAWGLAAGCWVGKGVQMYAALFQGQHCLIVLEVKCLQEKT
jgi:hypothetical protein